MKRHEIIIGLKHRMDSANRPGQTGIDAAIRRMDPANPGAAATPALRELAEAGLDLDGLHPEHLSAWLLIIHTLALARWRHEPRVKIGQCLAAMRLGDNRLKQLLSADFETLQQLLPRVARRFASFTEVPGMDFMPLARLALAASARSEDLEPARLEIARSYTIFENNASKDKR